MVHCFDLDGMYEGWCDFEVSKNPADKKWKMASGCGSVAVWPDWAIYWTLGNFSKTLASIILPKSPTFLGYFCKGVKILNFSSEIIFGQL